MFVFCCFIFGVFYDFVFVVGRWDCSGSVVLWVLMDLGGLCGGCVGIVRGCTGIVRGFV